MTISTGSYRVIFHNATVPEINRKPPSDAFVGLRFVNDFELLEKLPGSFEAGLTIDRSSPPNRFPMSRQSPGLVLLNSSGAILTAFSKSL
jgi:hypothetical protein